jgi:hypothetical protein
MIATPKTFFPFIALPYYLGVINETNTSKGQYFWMLKRGSRVSESPAYKSNRCLCLSSFFDALYPKISEQTKAAEGK